MWIAQHAAHTHVAVLVVAGIVVAGVIGIITTHKGNKR